MDAIKQKGISISTYIAMPYTWYSVQIPSCCSGMLYTVMSLAVSQSLAHGPKSVTYVANYTVPLS